MHHRYKFVTFLLILMLLTSLVVTTGFSASPLRLRLFSTGYAASGGELPLTDATGHWAEAGIAEMYVKKVMRGYQDGTFRPNKPVSFLEAVVITDKLLYGKPQQDVNDDYLNKQFNIPQWAVSQVAAAMRHNILYYEQLQKVALQQPLTRQDGAVLAVRALNLTELAKTKRNPELPFSDLGNMDSATKACISIVWERQIMTGFPNGRFQPNSPVTRGEMAVILSRVAEQLPYVNSDEASGFVSSVNQLTSVVSMVYSDGTKGEIVLPAKYLLYVNDKPAEIGMLSEGIYLRLIRNSSLTLLLAETLLPDTGAAVSVDNINLALESGEVQDWVEKNKANEAYLVNRQGNRLYFLAGRGERMTGGYSVDITKVSVFTDQAGTHYRVRVDRTDPGRGAIVKQVITYPLDLAALELPPNLHAAKITVTFVDNLNKPLAELALQ